MCFHVVVCVYLDVSTQMVVYVPGWLCISWRTYVPRWLCVYPDGQHRTARGEQCSPGSLGGSSKCSQFSRRGFTDVPASSLNPSAGPFPLGRSDSMFNDQSQCSQGPRGCRASHLCALTDVSPLWIILCTLAPGFLSSQFQGRAAGGCSQAAKEAVGLEDQKIHAGPQV